MCCEPTCCDGDEDVALPVPAFTGKEARGREVFALKVLFL